MRFKQVGKVRLLCFDLENRPLAYWFDGETTSEITAFAWKWADEKQVSTMLLCPNGDFACTWAGSPVGSYLSAGDAYEHFSETLAFAGIVYGHNIRRHDLPMLNAGLIRRQLPALRPMLTSDTCRDLPRRRGLSYSLENMVAMYGIKGAKYTMSQPMWENANRLTADGMALARKRVTSDVLLQERLRKKLLDVGLLKLPKMWSA